ncbi:MAG: alpha/beta hydrolase [Actinobacteria bacterium]|nr:alpha/beta hydrolase [Actinomycetota bacterium]MBU1609936.1 alpha/beta hydrolase [Actinomycetota bacterium]MBU2315278.1 alpha/beta hydrolase [Actinomycetota bacterium]MBU2384587.1 alpha/beta hydrolase [Actinomycetota bacterium]
MRETADQGRPGVRRDIEFRSGGDIVRGWLYTPDEGEGPFPTVVMAGGWCYVKEIVQPHYADMFADHGIAAVLFDYRNFGDSDGERRQHIDPHMQIEDYRNAISFAETLDEVDEKRIGSWGLSYSGGHSLILAAIDSRVKVAVSQIPVIDGYLNMRLANGTVHFRRLEAALLEARRRLFTTGEDTMVPHFTRDAESEISAWPNADGYELFEGFRRTVAPNYSLDATAESIDLLMQYDVRPFAKRIVDTPTLVIVAENDDVTLWDEAMVAYQSIPTSAKEFVIIDKSDHLALYSNQTLLERAAAAATRWFVERLVPLGR